MFELLFSFPVVVVCAIMSSHFLRVDSSHSRQSSMHVNESADSWHNCGHIQQNKVTERREEIKRSRPTG